MNTLIGHLYARYAIVIPRNLKIARAHTKSSQFAFISRFLVTDLNNTDSSASVFTSLVSGQYPATQLSQLARHPRYIASGRTQQKTTLPAMFLLLFGAVA
jgi:hypothetical protein